MQQQDLPTLEQTQHETTNQILLAISAMLGSVVFFVFVVPNIIFFGVIALMVLFAGG